jgi:hypothetical protein
MASLIEEIAAISISEYTLSALNRADHQELHPENKNGGTSRNSGNTNKRKNTAATAATAVAEAVAAAVARRADRQ